MCVMPQWASRLGCKMQTPRLLRTLTEINQAVQIWLLSLKKELRLFWSNTETGVLKHVRSPFERLTKSLPVSLYAWNNSTTAEMMTISDICKFQ
jgi:hypothetical protein